MTDTALIDKSTADVPAAEMKAWLKRFKFYRDPPDEDKVLEWLAYFEETHRAVASKVLDKVTVVGEREIQAGYRAALGDMPGWNIHPKQRNGRWFFVGFGRQGESGPAMLRMFREANRLSSQRYDHLFKTLTELPGLQLTAHDNVVFVDDFAGTGDQITRLWPVVAELIASEAKCYIVLTALTDIAEKAINDQTELIIRAKYVLGPDDSVFHEDNESFSDAERAIIHQYCEIADEKNPKGYGKLGVLFVLSHKTPNNALPILYANTAKWKGLFPRYLEQAA